jgi:hypothetical protein
MTNQSNNLSGKKPRATTASKAKPKPVSKLSTAYRGSRSRKEPSVETAETKVDDKIKEVDLTDDNGVEGPKARRRSPRKPNPNVSYSELDGEPPEDPPLANVDPAPLMNDDQPPLNEASTNQSALAQPSDKASKKKKSVGTKKKGNDANTNDKSIEQPPTEAAMKNTTKAPKDATEKSKKRKEPPAATNNSKPTKGSTKGSKKSKKNPTDKSPETSTVTKDSKTSRKNLSKKGTQKSGKPHASGKLGGTRIGSMYHVVPLSLLNRA